MAIQRYTVTWLLSGSDAHKSNAATPLKGIETITYLPYQEIKGGYSGGFQRKCLAKKFMRASELHSARFKGYHRGYILCGG
jgi:hypothetical protein